MDEKIFLNLAILTLCVFIVYCYFLMKETSFKLLSKNANIIFGVEGERHSVVFLPRRRHSPAGCHPFWSPPPDSGRVSVK